MILFHQHNDTFLLWPALIVTRAQCDSPGCREVHTSVSLTFWLWTVSFVLSAPHG